MRQLDSNGIFKVVKEALEERKSSSIAFPLEKLNGLSEGIVDGAYITVCGRTGSGKKSFIDYAFMMNPILQYLEILNNLEEGENPPYEFSVLYFCNKSNWTYKIKKLVALYLKISQNILTDVKSLNKSPDSKVTITSDDDPMVLEATTFICDLLDSGILKIHEGTPRPIDVQTRIIEHYNGYGVTKTSSEGFINEFTPHDEDTKIKSIVIIESSDRLKMEATEFGILSDQSRLEGRLDNFMKNCQQNLNTTIVIGQSATSYVRYKSDAEPKYSDAGTFTNSSNLILGLFNPFREGFMDKYIGYDVKMFITPGNVNRFRTVSILKNDYGIDSGNFGVVFLPECGYFFQLPDNMISNFKIDKDLLDSELELQELVADDNILNPELALIIFGLQKLFL